MSTETASITPDDNVESSPPVEAISKDDKKTLTLIYALMAGGIFFFPLIIAAFVINMVKRSEAQSKVAKDHHRWQIRTFAISVVVGIIGIILAAVVIGYLVILLNGCWVIYRVVKGWIRLSDEKSVYA